MYLEAMQPSWGQESSESPPDAVPMCVLLTMCRQLGMGDHCQQNVLTSVRNVTSRSQSVPAREKAAIVGMLSVFALLGTLGNGLVLAVYVRKPNKTASTVFIICLAATDLVTSCVIMPFTMTMESLNYVIVYDALCKAYFFLITCNVPFAAFVMVAIAVDRYLSICRPHCRLLDARKSQMGVLGLALVSVMLGVFTALFHGVYVREVFNVAGNDSQLVLRVRNDLLKELRPDALSEVCGNSSHPDCEQQTREATLTILDSLAADSISQCQLSGQTAVLYTGQCRHNQLLFSTFFRKTYQKVYASVFLLCFLFVFLLYIAIYRSVLLRRTRKLKARQGRSTSRNVSVTDSQLTFSPEVPLQDGVPMSPMGCSGESQRRSAERQHVNSLKEKYLLANIRTAVMLFVVTLVFVLAFLPAWLMAHNVLPYNSVVFYCYFLYNVCNPIIYAFMNASFRKDLQELMPCRAVRGRRSVLK